jgi:phosphatidylglycerol---prolipoprotein diacylglyceryl transferase
VSVGQIQLWSEPFAAGAYTAAVATAALVVPLVAARLAVTRGLPLGRVAVCLGVTAAATLAGSRLLHWWTHPGLYEPDPSRLWSLDSRDFSLYGGLLLAGLAGIACSAAMRINIWKLADCVAPALGIGIAITRVGCFVNGCCFGVQTDLPWGVVYPGGSPAHWHQIGGNFMTLFSGCRAVHPTQIYEMLAAGAAALLALVLLSRRNVPSGVPFLAAAVVFTAFRWFNDPLRVNAPTLVTTGWSYRLLYATLVVIGSAALLWRLRPTAVIWLNPSRSLICRESPVKP